jgi:hypothetical protein
MQRWGQVLKVIGLLLILLPLVIAIAVTGHFYGGNPDGAAAIFVAAMAAVFLVALGIILLFLGYGLTGPKRSKQ